MAQPDLRIRIPKKLPCIIGAVLAALALAGAALAEYLGPDRVTTEFREVRDPDNDVWTLTRGAEVCLIVHTCEEHPSTGTQLSACGWIAVNSGCDRAYKIEEVTIVLPEATISSDLQGCVTVDGWCTETPTLHLVGTEPVAGEAITLIEGTRNGEPFACPGAVCDVPLVQGANQFTFWALSSWGDSSLMGTLSANVDSKGPKVSIPDSWYIWEPLAIQVEDGQHGIDKVSLTIDGGEYGYRSYSWEASQVPDGFIWDRHFEEVIAPIGEYPVAVRAWDTLGNSASAHGEIVIPELEPAAESAEASAPAASAGTEDKPADDPADLITVPSSGLSNVADTSDAESEAAGTLEPLAGEPAVIENLGPVAELGSSVTTTDGGGSGLLWGAAALAAAASATAYGLSRRRARERRIEQMRHRAAEMNSAEARQARRRSIWNAAQARVAPIRAAMASAAAAAAALAAVEAARRRKKILMKRAERAMEPANSPDDEGDDPKPTPTYYAPTVTASPALASPNATPLATPSATILPTATPTSIATPSPFPILPTNLPGTPIVDTAKLPRQIGSVITDFIDSFLPFGEPSALDAYGWDPLTPFESAPYVGRLVPVARAVLTVVATAKQFLQKLLPLEPTYPMPEPVPQGPPGEAGNGDAVS